jgi:hypothetical protein
MKSQIFKAISFAFIFATLSNSLKSQTILWQKSIGGSSTDKISAAIIDNEGNILIAGTSGSDISEFKSEDNLGSLDFWIVKLDQDGNIIWENTIGGNAEDFAYCVKQTLDGGYIVGGYSFSDNTFDKTSDAFGEQDYWVVKLDYDGNVEWDKSFGGYDEDLLFDIEVTSDGGYILMGESGSDDNGNKTIERCYSAISWPDYWFLKLDAAGEIVWQNMVGGITNDWGREIVNTSDGNYIISGRTDADIDCEKTVDNLGSIDYYLTKIEVDGNDIWQKEYGGNLSDYLEGIIPTSDNGFLLIGYSSSPISDSKTEGNIGNTGYMDYWVVKLDHYGEIQWQNTIGGKSTDALLNCTQTIDGGYLLAGYSNSEIFADKTEAPYGNHDYWFVELNVFGEVVDDFTIGGTSDDLLVEALQTNDYGYLLLGYSESNLTGIKTVAGLGSDDIWMVKIAHDINIVEGTVAFDFNSNEIIDGDDFYCVNKLVQDETSGAITLTTAAGKYAVGIETPGTYITSTPAIEYYSVVPANYTGEFIDFGHIDTGKHFLIQPIGDFTDLCISAIRITPFRPGFEAIYHLMYNNVGTTTASGTIAMYPSEYIVFDSADIAPVLITADSILWSIAYLSPFETGSFNIYVSVIEAAPLDSTAISLFQLTPVVGDDGPECNYDTVSVVISGAFDPNNITVDKTQLSVYEVPLQPALEYTINFQNTGTDTAFLVQLINPLPEDLILASLIIKETSHTLTYFELDDDNNLIFQFADIQLPPTAIDEVNCHGFITYEMQTQTDLIEGDIIANEASIIFDFNTPVITNTATTEIIVPTVGINNKPQLAISVKPNPFTNATTIYFNTYLNYAQIEVTDINGKQIFKDIMSGTEWNFIPGDINPGLYFVHLTQEQIGTYSTKIVLL